MTVAAKVIALPTQRQTLAQVRDSALRRAIAVQINAYVERGVRVRRCAWCGREFEPRSRYHFLAHEHCRRAWYRGVFRPRKEAR